jgi:hypothetical protein
VRYPVRMANTKRRKRPAPAHVAYDDVEGMIREKYITHLGLWMERWVWRGYSPMATWITDTVDKLPPTLAPIGAWVVRTLGTGNYFD